MCTSIDQDGRIDPTGAELLGVDWGFARLGSARSRPLQEAHWMIAEGADACRRSGTLTSSLPNAGVLANIENP
jgi:hypothetical protein